MPILLKAASVTKLNKTRLKFLCFRWQVRVVSPLGQIIYGGVWVKRGTTFCVCKQWVCLCSSDGISQTIWENIR